MKSRETMRKLLDDKKRQDEEIEIQQTNMNEYIADMKDKLRINEEVKQFTVVVNGDHMQVQSNHLVMEIK